MSLISPYALLRCRPNASLYGTRTATRIQFNVPLVARRKYSKTLGQHSNTRFDYQVSAAFSAKSTPFNPLKHSFSFNPSDSAHDAVSPSDLPYAQKVRHRFKSGEDAFFIGNLANKSTPTPPADSTDSPNIHNTALAFGVADGVGGWADSGVDPAHFSHSLCEYMKYSASSLSPPPSHTKKNSTPSAQKGNPIDFVSNPTALLRSGYDLVMADKNVAAGGSTGCIGTVSSSGTMTIANLGDSGFVHISPFRLAHLSKPQTNAFNTP